SRAQPGLLGERDQKRERLVGDAILGVIEEDAGRFGRQPLAASGILCKERSQMHITDVPIVMRERVPGPGCRERLNLLSGGRLTDSRRHGGHSLLATACVDDSAPGRQHTGKIVSPLSRSRQMAKSSTSAAA